MGEVIKIRRRELEKSQEDFAIDTGLGRGHLTELENGKRAMSLKTLMKVAEGLNTLPSILLPKAEKHLDYKAPDELNLIDKDAEFLNCLINHTNFGLVVTDPNQNDNPIVYANMPFQEPTQYSRAAMLGTNCRFLQGSARDQRGIEEVRDAIRQVKPVVVILKKFKKDGTLLLKIIESLLEIPDQTRRIYGDGTYKTKGKTLAYDRPPSTK